jgi:hypothetical protein
VEGDKIERREIAQGKRRCAFPRYACWPAPGSPSLSLPPPEAETLSTPKPVCAIRDENGLSFRRTIPGRGLRPRKPGPCILASQKGLNLMSDDDSPLCRKEQIQVLMSEYNTLRSEILQKATSAFQINGVALSASVVILGAILAALAAGNFYLAVVGAIAVFVFAVPIWILPRTVQFSMHELGGHLIEVERAVNDLAGARLLTWETERGGSLPETQLRRKEYKYGPLLGPLRALKQNLPASWRN